MFKTYLTVVVCVLTGSWVNRESQWIARVYEVE